MEIWIIAWLWLVGGVLAVAYEDEAKKGATYLLAIMATWPFLVTYGSIVGIGRSIKNIFNQTRKA